jgi:hypothetical protein
LCARNENLAKTLVPLRRIDIAVIGRKSGRRISMPVWLVVEKNVLYLLPVNGTDTQWFKNLLHNPMIRVAARRGQWVELRAKPTTAPKQVSAVVRKFGHKYKASVVKKLYSKFDAAVRVPLR